MATHKIFCKLTGLQIGSLDLLTEAGKTPYIKAWESTIVEHPIFSLSIPQRLAFARAEWRRLAKASRDGDTTEREDTILRVSFLAVLHALGNIKQDVPALPDLSIVQTHMSQLFALAYWKMYLDSPRFKFPAYRICRANSNIGFQNIGAYLDLCFEVKDDYEECIESAGEELKLQEAEDALAKLRSNWAIPVANKDLWKWVRAYLPAKYEADAQGWMATIFLGKEKAILQFEKSEILLLQDIIVSECPPGTGMMHAVSARLNEIEKIYTDNKEAFTVDFEDFDLDTPMQQARAASSAPLSTEAPKEKDFAKKVDFIRAQALWYLQQRKGSI